MPRFFACNDHNFTYDDCIGTPARSDGERAVVFDAITGCSCIILENAMSYTDTLSEASAVNSGFWRVLAWMTRRQLLEVADQYGMLSSSTERLDSRGG